MSKITECPICGGVLQATIENYTVGAEIDAEGNVLDWGSVDHALGVDTGRIYCENDHTHDEIREALAKEAV